MTHVSFVLHGDPPGLGSAWGRWRVYHWLVATWLLERVRLLRSMMSWLVTGVSTAPKRNHGRAVGNVHIIGTSDGIFDIGLMGLLSLWSWKKTAELGWRWFAMIPDFLFVTFNHFFIMETNMNMTESSGYFITITLRPQWSSEFRVSELWWLAHKLINDWVEIMAFFLLFGEFSKVNDLSTFRFLSS